MAREEPSLSDELQETDRQVIEQRENRLQKKAKKSCRLTDEQEEAQVLEWVEKHPCLWNLKNKDYKNKALKDRLWGDKATELGVGG